MNDLSNQMIRLKAYRQKICLFIATCPLDKITKLRGIREEEINRLSTDGSSIEVKMLTKNAPPGEKKKVKRALAKAELYEHDSKARDYYLLMSYTGMRTLDRWGRIPTKRGEKVNA